MTQYPSESMFLYNITDWKSEPLFHFRALEKSAVDIDAECLLLQICKKEGVSQDRVHWCITTKENPTRIPWCEARQEDLPTPDGHPVLLYCLAD